MYGAIFTPAACGSRLETSLSMRTAEPKTPQPTYGRPAISNKPCNVPSSHNVPCTTGNTTSNCAPCDGVFANSFNCFLSGGLPIHSGANHAELFSGSLVTSCCSKL